MHSGAYVFVQWGLRIQVIAQPGVRARFWIAVWGISAMLVAFTWNARPAKASNDNSNILKINETLGINLFICRVETFEVL